MKTLKINYKYCADNCFKKSRIELPVADDVYTELYISSVFDRTRLIDNITFFEVTTVLRAVASLQNGYLISYKANWEDGNVREDKKSPA